MALKDSFINLNKALRTTLQNVPAVVDTLIRGFDEIGDAVEEQSTYSTTDEHVVGTWIDGKPIYEKTINFGALPNNTVKEYSLDSNIQVVNFEAVGISGGYTIPLPYIYPGEGGIVALYTAGNKLRIQSNSDRSDFTGYITLRYTKSSNRSPENGTKNVIEDEITLDPAPVEELKK